MRDLAGHLEHCSINTATLGHRRPIGETLDAIARAGFGAVAPWRREVEEAGVVAVARQLRALGLAVSGYCRSAYLTAPTRAAFLAALDENRRAIDQAAELGAACFVVVHGGLAAGSRDLAGARAQGAEAVALLWEHARERGVALAVEPLHPMYAADRSVLVTLEQALDLCDAIDPGARGGLGVAVDAYHCWWDPRLEPMIRRAGASRRLLAFHVSDWLVPTRDLLLDRGMMGDGVIELARLRAMVEDAGYRGAVEVEIFSRDDWWQRDAAETLSVAAERLQSVC